MTPCPGALFEKLLPNQDGTKAFYDISRLTREQGGAHADHDEAVRTVEKIQEADAHDKVLVVLAHDTTLLKVVDFFPKYANDFASKDWVNQGRWAFLKDFEQALDDHDSL